MTRVLPALSFAFGVALLASAQDVKSPLEKLEPAKVPANLRPGKVFPKEVIAALGARGDKVDCCAFRDDGKQLLISGPDQIVRVWNLDGPRFVGGFRQPDSVVCLAFTPDRKTIVTGDAGGNVRLLNVEGTLKTVLLAHKDGPALCIAVSADGKRLATGGRDKIIKVWDISKPKIPAPEVLTGHGDAIRGVAFAPDGDWLASVGYDDKQLRVWDIRAKPKAGEVVTLPGKGVSVAFAPGGEKLATAGEKGVNRVWSFKGGKPENPVDLDTDGRAAVSASFSPDGQFVTGVAAHTDTEDRVIVWTDEGKKKHEFKYGSHVHAVAFAPDGKHLAAVTESGTLLVRLPK